MNESNMFWFLELVMIFLNFLQAVYVSYCDDAFLHVYNILTVYV